jgi:uncharacterized protein
MAEIALVDPRPKVVEQDGQHLIQGWRCAECNYAITQEVPRCPECRGGMKVSYFGPTGTVHGSTTIRVRVPGQQHPYSLAYVLFPDGPRVLVHTPGDTPLPLRSTATLTGLTENGEIAAQRDGERV